MTMCGRGAADAVRTALRLSVSEKGKARLGILTLRRKLLEVKVTFSDLDSDREA